MAGELPSGWRMVKLGDLGEVNRGRSRHRPRYAEHLYGGPYPFVQTGDIRESGGRITSHQQTYSEAGLAQSRLWPAGTMCITIAANIAETAILTYPACFPDSVVGFIADPTKADVFFVEYMFRHLRQRIQHEATGSVQDNINLATLERLRFPLPPLKEQRTIARILGSLDDKIELNRRRCRTLEALARAIFQSWFVDFDPVRAKAAGQPPPGLKPELAALFPDRFQDSPLGPIPAGWRVGTVGEVADVVGGSTPSTKKDEFWARGTHHWATPKDLSKLSVPVLLDTERKITDSGLGCISSGLLPPGVVLLSSRAPIGYLAINEVPIAINQGFIAMKPKSSMSSQFLLRWAQASHDAIVARANGSTFLEISKANFRPIQLVVPTDAVLRAFDEICEHIFRRVVIAERESRTLAALRNALLPKLISGELRIPNVEQVFGRVS